MAEREQRHSHFVETGELVSETVYRILGLLAALGVVGGMVAGSVYCATTGHDAAATALGAGAGLACIAGVFIRGRNLTRMQDTTEGE